MSETSLNLSRRKFILVSSAAVATPFILNMAGLVHEAKGAEKQYTYTIGPGCLGCHYCFLECPASAIKQGDDTYVIDQKKCVHCGTCYKVCNAGIVTRK